MATLSNDRKDRWDKFKIIIEFFIAITVIMFTQIYNYRQQEIAKANLELARSNNKISSTQLKTSLLKPLLSDVPRERAMAIYLAEVIDSDFAVNIAKIYALNDSDINVRNKAGKTLKNLTISANPSVQSRAETAIEQYEVMNELRTKGLLKKVKEAENYIRGGNVSGEEKSLAIYKNILMSLSTTSIKSLDQKLLKGAEDDISQGYIEDAIQKYRSVFAVYQ